MMPPENKKEPPSGDATYQRHLPLLASLGKGLGTVSVYGTEHPGVDQILDQIFRSLQEALQDRASISIGRFNGTLTVDEEPASVSNASVRTLEKRLDAMKISHLALTKGLTRDELKSLLTALCAPSETKLKESLSGPGMPHVKMSDVRYVALREGEETSGKTGGTGEGNEIASGEGKEAPTIKVSQIVAFLKGEPSGSGPSGDLKKMLSDPERLGQMIIEAARIRQSAITAQDGESLADIVVGCLRRTYDGVRKETEFRSPQGKVNLTKAMMLLEKNVLDKIHAALGAQHPEIDRRIFDAIREMEEEQQFEMLTAQYFDQRQKMERAEKKIIERIQTQGVEAARAQFENSGIPQKDWQKLMIKAGADSTGGGGSGDGSGGSGFDMSVLAVVLEKMEGLMQIGSSDPKQLKTAVHVTRTGLTHYADRIESRIQELEGQVELRKRDPSTVESHADHLNRESLMVEVSRLTLALLQPLTVINASVEAAMRYADQEIQKDLLDLAFKSGIRMKSLTRRLTTLVGYPVLGKS